MKNWFFESFLVHFIFKKISVHEFELDVEEQQRRVNEGLDKEDDLRYNLMSLNNKLNSTSDRRFVLDMMNYSCPVLSCIVL